MIQFERILFPVDFSVQCRNAAPFVRSMRQRFDAELLLLHILELPMHFYAPPEAAAWTAMSSFEPIRTARKEQFDQFAEQMFPGIPATRELIEGEPAYLIKSYALEKKAGLIMLPTHGYGIFRRFLLGSVTAKVLNDVECPVWTGVHTAALLSHDPDVMRKILCAVPPEEHAATLVGWAHELGEKVQAEVRLIQAAEAGDESAFKAAHHNLEQAQREARTDLKATVRGGRPAHAVKEEADDWGADVVVIGRGKHHAGRLRSDEYEIIRESPCPVISV